jgi:hypothetical protein
MLRARMSNVCPINEFRVHCLTKLRSKMSDYVAIESMETSSIHQFINIISIIPII